MEHSKDQVAPTGQVAQPSQLLEWVGLAISFVSLLVALLSAYITLYYTKDDLRLLVQRYSVSASNAEAGSIGLTRDGTADLILMNLGTRNAAVIGVEGRLGEPTNCHPRASDIYISYNFEPKVIEPGKMTSLAMKVAGFSSYGRIGNQAVEKDGVMFIPDRVFYPGMSEIEVCLRLRIVTPAVAETATVKIGTMKIGAPGARPSPTFETLQEAETDKQTPLVLHQRGAF